jgi:hypothetical protein
MQRNGFYRAEQGKALPSRPCPAPCTLYPSEELPNDSFGPAHSATRQECHPAPVAFVAPGWELHLDDVACGNIQWGVCAESASTGAMFTTAGRDIRLR